MSIALWILFGCCIAVALVGGTTQLILLVENRRFWKVHQQRPAPSDNGVAKVNLIVPCKGLNADTRKNLEGFFRQDHANFKISFVAEDGQDPVVQTIRELQAENRFVQSVLIIAGKSTHCGQKVHNLLAAVDRLTVDVDILAFADADIMPKPSWLRWLTAGVGREKVGARTGFRWMVPTNKTIPTMIGVSLNNAIAACLGKGRRGLVWGGSWAIHRQVFERIGIREAWTQTLSDDLVASRAIGLANLQIQFEPQCVCPTEISFSWSSLSEFVNRQLRILRMYSPRHWLTGLVASTGTQIAFWGSLALGMTRGFDNNGGWWLLLAALIYVGGVARAAIRQNMARRMVLNWRQKKRARRYDLWLGPVSGFVGWMMFLSSAFGSRITWSNIHYYVSQGGRILVLGRNIESEKWPVRLGGEPEIESNTASKKPPRPYLSNAKQPVKQ